MFGHIAICFGMCGYVDGVDQDEKAVDALVGDLKSFISETPNVTLAEEKYLRRHD
jgi:hypothetical protein